MTVSVESLVDGGRAARRCGDAATARLHFQQALATATSGDALEGLARASYIEHAYPTAARPELPGGRPRGRADWDHPRCTPTKD